MHHRRGIIEVEKESNRKSDFKNIFSYNPVNLS